MEHFLYVEIFLLLTPDLKIIVVIHLVSTSDKKYDTSVYLTNNPCKSFPKFTLSEVLIVLKQKNRNHNPVL